MITQDTHLLSFLNDLRKGKIYYRLSQHRDDAIMVEVSVPGERWEVEFLKDGTVEAEVFRSDGNIRDASSLEDIVKRHADTPSNGLGLSDDAKRLMQLISDRIHSGSIRAADPKTFLGYKEVHDLLGLQRRGDTWGNSLRKQGLDELAFWAKDHGRPPITALIIDKDNLSPGKGWFHLYGKSESDLSWWLNEQVPLVLREDWQADIKKAQTS